MADPGCSRVWTARVNGDFRLKNRQVSDYRSCSAS
ncbi:hypothetical protein ABH930_000566 [Kitasatospora sp. GAS204A]|nr:hypothetical protein [Kitasatospora sp. GAS204B]